MLKQMRTGAKSPFLKFFLFGLLLLAMGGLAVMDGHGSFTEVFKDNNVLRIGRERISAPTFDRMVQNAIYRDQLKQSDAYRNGIQYQVLKEKIDRTIFAMAVRDEGLRVDDASAARQIKDILAPHIAQGMSQKDALAGLLRAVGMTEADFVSSLKTDIGTRQLIDVIYSGAAAPAQLASDLLKFRGEARRGEYFRLTPESAGAVPIPSEDELKRHYEARATDYATPEMRTLSVLVVDKNALGEEAKVPEEKLREYYEENLHAYGTPETRVIAQVVADDEATAQAIFAAATKSKNLEAAAKANKGAYIGPQKFTQDKIAAELAKTAFAGAAGDVLTPVQSPLGWHILHVQKVTPGKVQSFEEVKAAIAKDMSQEKASEALYNFATKLDDEIAGGKSVSDVAKENRLTETTLEKIDARGMTHDGQKAGATLPVYERILETGFRLEAGDVSPLIETADGGYVIVGIKDVFPSEKKPFESVREDIRQRWLTEKRLQVLSEKATAITARLQKGESFATIAAEFRQPVQSTEMVKRGSTPPKSASETLLLDTIFSLDTVGQARAIPGDGTVTVIRLAERKTEPASEKDVKDMEDLLSRAVATDLLAQYRMTLVDKYNVKVNNKLLASMYANKGMGEE